MIPGKKDVKRKPEPTKNKDLMNSSVKTKAVPPGNTESMVSYVSAPNGSGVMDDATARIVVDPNNNVTGFNWATVGCNGIPIRPINNPPTEGVLSPTRFFQFILTNDADTNARLVVNAYPINLLNRFKQNPSSVQPTLTLTTQTFISTNIISLSIVEPYTYNTTSIFVNIGLNIATSNGKTFLDQFNEPSTATSFQYNCFIEPIQVLDLNITYILFQECSDGFRPFCTSWGRSADGETIRSKVFIPMTIFSTP